MTSNNCDESPYRSMYHIQEAYRNLEHIVKSGNPINFSGQPPDDAAQIKKSLTTLGFNRLNISCDADQCRKKHDPFPVYVLDELALFDRDFRNGTQGLVLYSIPDVVLEVWNGNAAGILKSAVRDYHNPNHLKYWAATGSLEGMCVGALTAFISGILSSPSNAIIALTFGGCVAGAIMRYYMPGKPAWGTPLEVRATGTDALLGAAQEAMRRPQPNYVNPPSQDQPPEVQTKYVMSNLPHDRMAKEIVPIRIASPPVQTLEPAYAEARLVTTIRNKK